MAKTAGSYVQTRYNALKHGVHQTGPLSCRGPERCHYSYCRCGYTPPSDGSPCPWEDEFVRRFEEQFRAKWDLLTITPDVEDFDELVAEAVLIRLQQTRAFSQMNESWDMMEADRPEAFKQFRLAQLYLRRLQGRHARVDAKLQEGLDRMRDRAEKLRPHLQAIEIFIEGKKRAAEELSQPREPLRDEFVDGPTVDDDETTPCNPYPRPYAERIDRPPGWSF